MVFFFDGFVGGKKWMLGVGFKYLPGCWVASTKVSWLRLMLWLNVTSLRWFLLTCIANVDLNVVVNAVVESMAQYGMILTVANQTSEKRSKIYEHRNPLVHRKIKLITNPCPYM